jgi:CRISPR system Cascade subunit CasA
MSNKAFNLLDEPWILVMNAKGDIEEVSLLEAFKQAQVFKGLAGELPTQDVAILRLMLAILYAVFTKVDKDGNAAELTNTQEALNRWRQLWDMGGLLYGEIEQYLRHYEERFYLFHPETPFYQVAGLTTKDQKTNPVAQMIMDVPSRLERRFFSEKNGISTQALRFAEAARWLVNLQAWDYAGKKASIIDGAPDGGGTGWLGKLGVVYVRQANLFETLILNMVLLDRHGAMLKFGEPIWEQNPLTAKKLDRSPTGYVELLTWQSRRVLLFREKDAVIGILSSYGSVFEKENTFIEQMSGWHRSTEKSKENKSIPNLHSSSRSVWRDLGAILPQYHKENSKESSDTKSVPGIISWIGLLKSYQMLDLAYVHLCTVGAEYGAMQGVVNELIADAISINANIFTTIGERWLEGIFVNIEKTDKCVWQLGILALDLAAASGNDDVANKKGRSGATREQAYFLLDMPFRQWLKDIDPENGDIDKVSKQWIDQMKTIVLEQGQQLVQEAGEKAFIGRSFAQNATVAFAKFKAFINKIIKG